MWQIFMSNMQTLKLLVKKPISISIDDNVKYTVKEYKQKLYDDILQRKKEVRKKCLI